MAGSVLGTRVLRSEDPKFLTSGGVYMSDFADPLLAGALFATYVRSDVAHGHIVAIHTDDAKGMPGVVAVLTGSDLGLVPSPTSPFTPGTTRTALAMDKVRHVGEPIAVVLSETASQGEDAAAAVHAEYTQLPVVVDVLDALKGETLLFEETGSNVVFDTAAMGMPQDIEGLFDGCEVVVSFRTINQRVAPCPLEVRGSAAAWVDGRIVYWTSTQQVQGVRDALAGVYEGSNPRVITPDVGGGFGAKIGPYVEDLLLPALAKVAGRPVRWHEHRSESMTNLGHGRAQVQDVTIGGSRDGDVQAYRLTIAADVGAYPNIGTILPAFMTRTMASAVYDIPKMECSAKSVVTNTTAIVAYRGAGRPEATAAMERAMDMFALEIGMDPVDVRRKNLVAKFDEAHTTPMGTAYDCGDYEGALDKALAAADYKGLRAKQSALRASGAKIQMGIGVSVYVEITGGVDPKEESARVIVNGDGSCTVLTGTSPHGQGHATSWAMLVHEQTGIPMDKVTVIHGDSDLIPVGGGTMGSRSLQQGGNAVFQVSAKVAEKARQLAAKLLEADEADVVLDKDSGTFHVAGTPSISKGWAELSVAAAAEGDPLNIEEVIKVESATYPFGAHVAVVDVDTETGKVRLNRIVACDDAGRVLNPNLLDGQIHGGIGQGAAQALFEEVCYDVGGNPITSNLAEYAFPAASEFPSFEVVHMETATWVNPLGAKGIGESGSIGSTPAIQSAVVDALSHLGVKHVEMPATPERVWSAISAAA
jgi:aerobic carbon-monoxide dehydrogenase large subunit